MLSVAVGWMGFVVFTQAAPRQIAEPAETPAPAEALQTTGATAETQVPRPVTGPPLNAAPSFEPHVRPPAPPARPRRYGDQGMPEIALGLGASTLTGFYGEAGFRYFVVDGVAPGIEGNFVRGSRSLATNGMLLASLRLIPIRTGSFALVLTGRAGRVFLGDHADGWGAGGGVGLLWLFAPTSGLEVGYEVLHLLPARFCVDLSTCVLYGPVFGYRFGL